MFFGIETSKNVHPNDTNNLLKPSVRKTSESEVEKLERLRQLVENKNTQGSITLARSRLFHCESNGVMSGLINGMFKERLTEVQELERLTEKIKNYIKQNKKTLIKERNDAERRIFEIKVNNNLQLKEHITKKVSRS